MIIKKLLLQLWISTGRITSVKYHKLALSQTEVLRKDDLLQFIDGLVRSNGRIISWFKDFHTLSNVTRGTRLHYPLEESRISRMRALIRPHLKPIYPWSFHLHCIRFLWNWTYTPVWFLLLGLLNGTCPKKIQSCKDEQVVKGGVLFYNFL